jgi:hypothetical protein
MGVDHLPTVSKLLAESLKLLPRERRNPAAARHTFFACQLHDSSSIHRFSFFLRLSARSVGQRGELRWAGRSPATFSVKSSRLKLAARALALICGCFLLTLTFWIQVFLTESGRAPGHLTALFLFGFPCGVLLNFARTGRRVWLAGLVVPALAIVQDVAVLAALRIWLHSRINHAVLSVAASWAVLLVGHHLFRRRPQSLSA